MRVLVSGYVGKKITGIGRNIISLLDNADDDIEFIIYVNYDMVEDFKFNNKNITVKTYNVSKNDSMKNLLWTTFKFSKLAKKEKCDMALIPNFTLLLKKKVPTVVILHDLIEFNIKDKFSKKKMFYRTKIADPITAKKATHIITVSENSKRDIIKFLGIKEEKISVIYDGVDLSQFNSENISNVVLPKNYILYVGTVDHPGKNCMNLIKAYEALKQSNKYDGDLVIAGMPGKGFEVVDNYVKNSPYCQNIKFLGYVNDADLPTLYSKSDLFCFLSLYEGFGIPPLEAMACGAKVLVSNRSSLPEVVGECGELVDPTDINEISKKIIDMINNYSVDLNKVQQHLESFDWNKLSHQFTQCLRRIHGGEGETK